MGLFKTIANYSVPILGGAAVGVATGNPLAGAYVGSTLYGAMEQKKAQDSANATNIQSAREQMDFQKNMSNTAYQRGMNDMNAAGLNPMLAYSQGGASSPAGSQATVQASSSGKGNALAKGISEAVSTASQMQTVKNATAQTASNVGLQSAQTSSAQATAKLADMNAIKTQADTQKTLQDAKQSAETFDDRKALIQTERRMQQVDADWQKTEKVMNTVQSGTSSLGNLISPFKGLMQKPYQGNSAQQQAPKRKIGLIDEEPKAPKSKYPQLN